MSVTIKCKTYRRNARPSFADFIRNAKTSEKKRVYDTVLTKAIESQNGLLEGYRVKANA